MNLLERIRRQFFFRAGLLNSLPKSGTHLLAKIVGALPGVHIIDFPIGRAYAMQFTSPGPSGIMIPLGVGDPHLTPYEEVDRALRRLARGTCSTTHVPFSAEMATLIAKLRIRMVTIVRDPRDVIVSHAKYMASTPGTRLFDYYQSLSEREQIMTSIVGIPKQPNGLCLLSIRDRLASVLSWGTQRFNYTTFFERLVGPQGRGSREVQIQEIRTIVRHLHIPCTETDITKSANNAFGGTSTFHTGVIGNWQEHCSAEHKQALKELVGQFLIDLGYEKNFAW